MFIYFFPLHPQPARWLQMWEVTGTSGIPPGTSSAAREDPDWLQPRPGGPVGPGCSPCRPAVPRQTGTSISKPRSHYLCVFMSDCCVLTFLQQLESLVWERSGSLFVSSHNDGGYAVWPVTSGNTYTHQPASSTIPYGEKCSCRHTHHVTVVTAWMMFEALVWSGEVLFPV